MSTIIKILGIVGVVSGIVAIKKRSESKKVAGKVVVKDDVSGTVTESKKEVEKAAKGTEKKIEKEVVVAGNVLKEEYHDFMVDAEKFVNQSVRKIKNFNRNVADKAKDLDEKAINEFNAKIAKITIAKDAIRTKIHAFKNSTEEKQEDLKSKIEIKRNMLAKSIAAFEKAWK